MTNYADDILNIRRTIKGTESIFHILNAGYGALSTG